MNNKLNNSDYKADLFKVSIEMQCRKHIVMLLILINDFGQI